MKKYDLIVIGSGPAGYVGAIRGATLGMNVLVIEKNRPGGVCLNLGCIPSKSLIFQAKVFSNRFVLEQMGVRCVLEGLDYEKVFQKSRRDASRLTNGIQHLWKKYGVEYLAGTARLLSGKKVLVQESGETIQAKNILLATGSRPKELDGFPFDVHNNIVSSDHLLMRSTLPKSLCVIGGGAIGSELAFVMNAFGTKVTIVEWEDRIIPQEDPDVSTLLASELAKQGIRLVMGKKIEVFKNKESGVLLRFINKVTDEPESICEFETVLVAVGRTPNTSNLGLEEIPIRVNKFGFIETNDFGVTSSEGIYAAGDIVSGTPLLAHVASKEAEIAVEHMMNASPRALDKSCVVSAIYCSPEVASFGLTEPMALRHCSNLGKFVLPYLVSGKAIADNVDKGFLKILWNKDTKEILGCHIVGEQASQIIHEALLAKSAELLPEDIADMVHAHPTLSELVMESMKGVENRIIHY